MRLVKLCRFSFRITPLLSNVTSFDFCGKKGNILLGSQNNISTVHRNLYYAKAGVPAGGSYRNGRTRADDEEGMGRPINLRIEDNVEK